MGVPWSIVDPSNLVNNARTPNAKKMESVGGWKRYSQYDVMNPHEKYRTMIKDNLRHEINNIAIDLALKRETSNYRNKDKMNSTYHATNTSWKSPHIEAVERNFNETSRFFNTHKTQGTRYIVPPKAEYLAQLQEEQNFHDDKAKSIKNTLLSDTYSYKSKSKGKMNSQRYDNK